LVHGADEQGVGGWVQELFKCKPAIMRAFQAAKGVHKVLNGCGCCAIAFLVLLPLCGSQCVCNEDLCVLFFTQGGGGKDDDYVTRIEFRLLLVSLTTVLSAM
jgi:hypothetical protein